MSGRFGEAAARLAGLAGALLGWRPDEFWRATPAELAAIAGALLPDTDAAATRGDLKRLMEMFPDD
ncbi:MAG: phage tail assembly chaperone [Sphingomonadaceae bacterium]